MIQACARPRACVLAALVSAAALLPLSFASGAGYDSTSNRSVLIEVKSSAKDDGNKAEFYLNGTQLDAPNDRGLNFVVLTAGLDGMAETESFDTYADDGSDILDYVETIPAGRVVLVSVKDEASNKCESSCQEALALLGAQTYPENRRESWAMIGRSGGPAIAEEKKAAGNGAVEVQQSFIVALSSDPEQIRTQYLKNATHFTNVGGLVQGSSCEQAGKSAGKSCEGSFDGE